MAKVFDGVFSTSDFMINGTKNYRWNGFLAPLLIVVTLVSNYVFINAYGIVGAAIATSITIFSYSIIKYFLVFLKLKMNLLSLNHIFILINAGIVVLLFAFKPRVFENNFLEIILNSLIITIVFIGGNLLMKSSDEMNELINRFYRKLTKTGK